MYEKRTPPGTPPCKTCRVDLLPENIDAAEIFLCSRGQVITRGMDGTVVEIDNKAIEAAMRIKGVEKPWECLNKVRRVFYHVLEASRES